MLRNLCWQLFSRGNEILWRRLVGDIKEMFGITLGEPVLIKERSEITLSYREASGVELDISSSGRGCQQVLLLLSYLLANPGAVLLLDEPDAHLEILRQRDVYNPLTSIASENDSQIIAASHSEVVLQEAAEMFSGFQFVFSCGLLTGCVWFSLLDFEHPGAVFELIACMEFGVVAGASLPHFP